MREGQIVLVFPAVFLYTDLIKQPDIFIFGRVRYVDLRV